MKNLLLIFALSFFISCSNNSKKSDIINPHLIRIDSLITIQNEKLSQDFLREFARNPAITKNAYYKCAQIHEFVKETENVLLNDSILINNDVPISTLLIALYPEFDKLNFDMKFFNPLKLKYFQYWIDKNPKNPLSKDEALSIIIDLKMFYYEIMSHLYYNITSNDFNFNLLKPIVIEKSNRIKVGDIYEAKICFTAFDTTRYAIIKIDNTELEMQNGYGIYRYHSNKPGKKTFRGVIMFPKNNWEFVEYPFEQSFIVY
jgi:hypothetical protein